MEDANRLTKLVSLSDSELTTADPSEDVRGRKVIDGEGQDVGEVDDLLVDERERKVRFLRVAAGGFLGIGATKFLIPVEAVKRVGHDAVQVEQPGRNVAAAPAYDPDLADEREQQAYFDRLYGYYGYRPYWSSEHATPTPHWYF